MRKSTAMFIATMMLGSLITSMPRASEMINGVYQWQFLSGQNWPVGYNQNTGKPQNMIWAREEYSADFFQRINNALPESKINEAFLTDDTGSTITLTETAEVYVTFLHEGAGYKNAFGFFSYPTGNPPTRKEDVDVTIVFPNLSYPHMATGHRVNIGEFTAGTTIGFFIAANGYSWWTGVKDNRIPYYYSLSDLNPEHTAELRQHVVLLYDEEVQEVIMGFEDLPRTWGDNDFNDAVFSVKATPSTAIQKDTLVTMPKVNDSDADGVADEQDEFPNDYRKAYSSYYPSQQDWVTLAYEDNWPKLGDYDMNDLVIRERLQTIYSAQGGISGLKISGFIDARGASNANGFALRLMDVAPDAVKSASLSIAGERFDKFTEDYQTDAVIQLWRNSTLYTQTGESSGQCSHFNTHLHCEKFPPVPFSFEVDFHEDLSQLLHADLDFFIFRSNKRGHEIHFAGYGPTDLADPYLFGTHADDSDPAQQRYYKNAQNLPWGLKLNSDWQYPREYIDVLWAYPDYQDWVESSGLLKPDWYLVPGRQTHVFQ
ncbi:LruC domain-containing protein [Planctobacterium marinum]|uniref:LruC domain-containing protein n=1 Tax=Planctobacterium marinum TaxID=1631968 RepID=A0AA48HNW9_9ALTE|nr:LruC domain-containing protein [Planctobacterium marinum]